MRQIARIPQEFRSNDIEWLILEEDKEDTGGVFLFGHSSLSDECEFDLWYRNESEAKLHAESAWGISVNDWQQTD